MEPASTPWRVFWSRVSVKVPSRLRKSQGALWPRVAKPGEAVPPTSVSESRNGFGSCCTCVIGVKRVGSKKKCGCVSLSISPNLEHRLSGGTKSALSWGPTGFGRQEACFLRREGSSATRAGTKPRPTGAGSAVQILKDFRAVVGSRLKSK